jgi:peptidyl-prolyl cis-trans isomerase SurA
MRAKSIGVLLFSIIINLGLKAQTNGPVLFTVGNEPVTVREFKYIYEKNNSNEKSLYSEKSLHDYLDLYENFKLKVKAAREAGMDTSAKFIKEFKNYRSQLAQPYLTDRQVTQRLVDEAYDRLNTEVRASHILITLSPDASPKDSLAAYNKAMEARNKILKGEDFAKVAKEYSKDPSVTYNSGDLGYFTSFQMIYPFENSAYNLKNIGDISMPVRTRFGYHIIKVTGKRNNRGEVKVRNILVNNNEKYTNLEQQNAKNKIDTVYRLLQKGVKFQDLAKQYSDHLQSKENGGELATFNSFASFPDEFKDAAFGLQNPGDYSKPFKTTFGWHIVQLVEKKPLQNKKELEEFIKQKISRDTRADASKDAAIARFKNEDKFKEEKKSLEHFTKLLDTTLLHGKWKINDASKFNKTLFSLGDKKYTELEFAKYVEKVQAPNRYSDVSYGVKQIYKDFVNKNVLDYEDNTLETKHEEFKNVVNEYKEGILLFEITDKEVWSKAMQDSAGLLEFYNNNKEKYKWKDRLEAQIFDVKSQVTSNEVKALLKKGKTPSEITSELNKVDPLSSNVREGTYETGEIPALDKAKWEKGVQDMGKQDNRYYILNILSIKKPDYKKLSEIRGLVISDYQDYLEKKWLQQLRGKYNLTLNQAEYTRLVK